MFVNEDTVSSVEPTEQLALFPCQGIQGINTLPRVVRYPMTIIFTDGSPSPL